MVLAAALAGTALLILILWRRKKAPGKSTPQRTERDPARDAITRAVRSEGYEGWNWKEREKGIIRCRGQSGFYEEFAVFFAESGSLEKIARCRDKKALCVLQEEKALSEEALLAFYEGILSKALEKMQELADDLENDGPRWILAAPYNGGRAPERKELRALAKAFEGLGFQVLALRFTDGAIKLCVKASLKENM